MSEQDDQIHQDAEKAKEVLAEEVETAKVVVAEAAATAVEASSVVILGIQASVRTVKWMLAVMMVVTIGSILRAESVQNAADKSTKASQASTAAAEEARDAAKKASDDLAKAIESSQGGAIDPELIARSLNASIKAECILDREYNNPERICPA